MTPSRSVLLLIASFAASVFGVIAEAQVGREHINVVGSSTVYPFATTVAENFARGTAFRAPKVESTGSGGGMKMFCAGVGLDRPDVATASRPMTDTELARCRANGVRDVIEIKIGFDGIVIANSKDAPGFQLTTREIYLALAATIPDPRMAEPAGPEDLIANPFENWNEINPRLPPQPIEVLGPPPTSGTRDKLAERAMVDGCNTFPMIRALESSDSRLHQTTCQKFREDGRYIEAGESDTLIVRKLEKNPLALGIFGFSFLDQNLDTLQAATINGTTPNYDNILADDYALCRPLFLYVNREHLGRVPGLPEFLGAFTSEEAAGPDGYLTDRGMIPLPADERLRNAAVVRSLQPPGSEARARTN